MVYEEINEFYPTPETLLDKIFENERLDYFYDILEPSAGKGNIIEYLNKKKRYDRMDIDAIEIDPNLRATLIGKEIRVIADDFLSFNTFKHYDLIIMNVPFSNGDRHLLKAISLLEANGGGRVICILNAETLKNPCTNYRKDLLKKLENADIEYMEHEFSDAERKTNVEIAVVKMNVEKKKYSSSLEDELKKKWYSESRIYESTEIAPGNFIEAIVQKFNQELELGIKLINEYNSLVPKMLDSLKEKKYSRPLIELKVDGHDASVNKYVKLTRAKYWEALFMDSRFTKGMTNDLISSYTSEIHNLCNYDFSEYNIRAIMKDIAGKLCEGVEDTIIKLFDELSIVHHWNAEYDQNIHYYNGWATNKAHYVNKKVILPFGTYQKYNWEKEGRWRKWEIASKLTDLEKALDYLDGGLTPPYVPAASICDMAFQNEEYRNIEFKYFNCNFYKKGTIHIIFPEDSLALKRLNIFVGRKRNWLPPSYGKKSYNEMTPEEQVIIDEFEDGKDGYEKVMSNSEQYIYDNMSISNLLPDMTA